MTVPESRLLVDARVAVPSNSSYRLVPRQRGGDRAVTPGGRTPDESEPGPVRWRRAKHTGSWTPLNKWVESCHGA
jgi:hypothetical protein